MAAGSCFNPVPEMTTAYVFPGLDSPPTDLTPALQRPEVQWRLHELMPLLELAPTAAAGFQHDLARTAPDLFEPERMPQTAAALVAIQLGMADSVVRQHRPGLVTGYALGTTSRDVFAGCISFADAVAMTLRPAPADPTDASRRFHPPMLPVFSTGTAQQLLHATAVRQDHMAESGSTAPTPTTLNQLLRDQGVTRLIEFGHGGGSAGPTRDLDPEIEIRHVTEFWQ